MSQSPKKNFQPSITSVVELLHLKDSSPVAHDCPHADFYITIEDDVDASWQTPPAPKPISNFQRIFGISANQLKPASSPEPAVAEFASAGGQDELHVHESSYSVPAEPHRTAGQRDTVRRPGKRTKELKKAGREAAMTTGTSVDESDLEKSRVIRLPEVKRLTSMSRSGVYAAIADGEFPRQVRLSRRCVGWYASEIGAWLQSRQLAV